MSFCTLFTPGCLGVAGGWCWGARDPLPLTFVRELFYVPVIQAAKTRESEESTRNKSFPVLGSYLPHLQDRPSAVDYVFVCN